MELELDFLFAIQFHLSVLPSAFAHRAAGLRRFAAAAGRTQLASPPPRSSSPSRGCGWMGASPGAVEPTPRRGRDEPFDSAHGRTRSSPVRRRRARSPRPAQLAAGRLSPVTGGRPLASLPGDTTCCAGGLLVVRSPTPSGPRAHDLPAAVQRDAESK